MRLLASIACISAAALMSACGSSSSSSSSTAPSTPASTGASTSAPAGAGSGGSQLALSEMEYKITPATASVAKAGKITITMKNDGTITHSLAVQTPSGVVRAGDIAPGSSATLTVDASKAGHYTFYCPIDGHRQMGMQGTLVVGSGGGGSSGGGAAPASTGSTSSSSNPYGY